GFRRDTRALRSSMTSAGKLVAMKSRIGPGRAGDCTPSLRPVGLSGEEVRRKDLADLFLRKQMLLAQQIGNPLARLRRLLRDLRGRGVSDVRIERSGERGRADVVRLAALAVRVDPADALLDEHRQEVLQDLEREREL